MSRPSAVAPNASNIQSMYLHLVLNGLVMGYACTLPCQSPVEERKESSAHEFYIRGRHLVLGASFEMKRGEGREENERKKQAIGRDM